MRWIWTVVVGVLAGLIGTAFAFGLIGHVGTSNSAYKTRVPLLGATVAGTSQLARDTAEFGHMPIVHVYYTGLPPRDAWSRGPLAQCKADVIVSFNAKPSQVLSGGDNAAIAHFFDTAPRGHLIYWSYIHEPEHEIVRNEFTTAAYKAAWPHVAALANAAHNPYLRSTLILMAYDLRPGAHRNWKSYLPAGHIISTLAWDAYPGQQGGVRSPRPPAQFMGAAIAASKSVHMPYGFAEFGMSSTRTQPGWLNQVGAYLLRSGAVFGTLFDSPNVRPSFEVTNRNDMVVWRKYVQASIRANGVGGSPVGGGGGGGHHAVTGLAVAGLALSRGGGIDPNGQRYVTIGFRLNQRADVTVLVLNGSSTVSRLMAVPRQSSGTVQVRYYGYDSRRQPLATGQYRILVVASNSGGSATAETGLLVR